MKRILLPTDFSENALNAIFYALRLYGNSPCQFVLLNTFYIPYSSSDVLLSMEDYLSENAEKSFKNLLESINRNFPKKRFELRTEFRFGDVAEAISHMVKQKNIDLIIMGTQGASGLMEELVGSHTSDTIQKVMCPVIAVPENCRFQSPQLIILGIDPLDEDAVSRAVLAPILEIAHNYNSEIMVLSVIEDNEKAEVNCQKLDDLLIDIPHSYRFVYFENALQGIEAFIQTENISMVALINRKHNLFEQLFHKNITKKMALHSRIPLLVLNSET